MSPASRIAVAALAAALLASGPGAHAQSKEEQPKLSAAEKEAERKARLKLAEDGLAKLYKTHPDARAAVEKAAGYAVFDVSAIYAILFVGQSGKGVLFDNATKKPTY